MLSRRDLLKTTAAGFLPRPSPSPRGSVAGAAHRFHFVEVKSTSWFPVADPVAWALENQDRPILERAAERLGAATPADGDRIIRLVVRRCGLNLVEVAADRVRVDYWTQTLADLRPFFKARGLARPNVAVVLRERKRETAAARTGDEFLFGDPLVADFPFELFQSKWRNRFHVEPDDDLEAPWTRSGFGWDGVEGERIPWKALKSVWRRESKPLLCANCDTPTILRNFGSPRTGFLATSPKFLHVCPTCRRSFEDHSVKDVHAWMLANLDPTTRPGWWIIWCRRREWPAA